MSDCYQDYWRECISIAAEECDLTLTIDQLDALAESAKSGHEHYDMTFYSPPPSDRISDIEDEWKRKYKTLQAELEAYRNNAETAIKRALRQYDDASVSIGEYGEVFRHDGRTEQIQ